MAKLHVQMGDRILTLAKQASITGEPIVRHMAYMFPGLGYEEIQDQFMLGGDIIVAPILDKGKTQRTVLFPPGVWISDRGEKIEGPCRQIIDAPIGRLPWFKLQ